eukprot:TRINITY_DN2939_c0_g1_i1.p1 TRINITY_DN2939_c0_g1~~TRINITY_DN2939_c0_g1_i1.p1  ORF type:complete len:281 (+),score=62.40 TRINITY_DN2939_c0_g1_i1:36-878(+)
MFSSFGSRKVVDPTPQEKPHHHDTEDLPKYVVMSYNVNFGLLYDTTHSESAMSVANTIRRHSPDICLLQETNENFEAFFESELSDLYPYQLFRHSTHWLAGGMGILSKEPFQEISWAPPATEWFHGWILQADTPLGKLQFLNLHLRPPMQAGTGMVPSPVAFYDSKNDRLSDLRHWMALPEFNKELPTIVAGDFNESHEGMFWGKAIQWLGEVGMKDAIEMFAPGGVTWEWPLMFSMKLEAFFDHIFYHPRDLECIEGAIFKEGASDHFPVIATFVRPTQ